MKKFLAIVLTLALCLGLCSMASAETTTYKIGVLAARCDPRLGGRRRLSALNSAARNWGRRHRRVQAPTPPTTPKK